MLTRKERTHRLCTRGAMLEKFLGCPNELTVELLNTLVEKIMIHETEENSFGETELVSILFTASSVKLIEPQYP